MNGGIATKELKPGAALQKKEKPRINWTRLVTLGIVRGNGQDETPIKAAIKNNGARTLSENPTKDEAAIFLRNNFMPSHDEITRAIEAIKQGSGGDGQATFLDILKSRKGHGGTEIACANELKGKENLLTALNSEGILNPEARKILAEKYLAFATAEEAVDLLVAKADDTAVVKAIGTFLQENLKAQ